MLTLKKYANGRLYDTVNKQYVTKVQLSKLIEKKEKIKVVLAKNSKDVTKSVVASLSTSKKAKTSSKNKPLLDIEAIKNRVEDQRKWVVKQFDKGMDTILEMMSFPKRQQVTKLNADVRKLSKKIDDLQTSHAKARKKMKMEHKKEIENLTQQYARSVVPAETEPAAQTA